MVGFGGCDGNIVLVWWAWSWTIVFGGNFLLEEKLRIEGKKKRGNEKKEKEKEKNSNGFVCCVGCYEKTLLGTVLQNT